MALARSGACVRPAHLLSAWNCWQRVGGRGALGLGRGHSVGAASRAGFWRSRLLARLREAGWERPGTHRLHGQSATGAALSPGVRARRTV